MTELTRADRLNAIVTRLVGATHTITHPATADAPARGHANYEIITRDADRIIRVTDPTTGEVMIGKGKDVEAALAHLEAKYPALNS